MSKELRNIQDIKSAFISHCRELGCDENYIKVCENKFNDVETALKDFEYLKSLFSIEWFDKLLTDDKIRVMKIMGMKYE